MSKICENATQLIGKTPLIRLNNFGEKNNIEGTILAKLEMFNLTSSVKDRAAANMIDEAEKQGKIKPGDIIIEPTSGNTGIGLAAIASAKGYYSIMVMPETMSVERRKLLSVYGAKIVLTDGVKGMKGAVERANEIQSETPNSFVVGQFENPANSQAHFLTTGPEIWEDSGGKVDIFVACVGTGGTITGVGEFLKSKNKDIEVVAVEPESSPVLSGGSPSPHKIQGIGAGFIPTVLNTSVYDEVITVSDEDAFEHARKLAKSEGVFCGISSGAALCASAEIARRPENKDKVVVTIFPDTGERYLSTALLDK